MLDLTKLRANLQDEGSPLSLLSKEMIHHLYQQLVHSEGKLSNYRHYWLKEFTFIYGDVGRNTSTHRKIQPSVIAEEYELEGSEDPELFHLFYAIQTFFCLFIKLVTYKLVSERKKMQRKRDKQLIVDILSGEYFNCTGIENYCYPDWFCWIIDFLDEEFVHAIFRLMEELNQFDTVASIADYREIHQHDQIKQIYENMIPHSLRHALGEFYTPDWLALHTIGQAFLLGEGENQQEIKTWLDPTCGSGTFLFKVIQQLRAAKPGIGLKEIIASVRGFDLNPVAVLTAKTTYLMAVIDLIEPDATLQLPIFHYDVIHTPEVKQDGLLIIDLYHDTYEIPLFVLKPDLFTHFKRVLLEELPAADFIGQAGAAEKKALLTFCKKLQATRDKEMRMIMANVLLNRLEAYRLGKADVVIGNPPWVNWEYLPKEYREKSQHLWTEYGLFARKGRDLSFAKEDISILITYTVIDKFLKQSGHLAFVIKQGIFKSEKNGIGFRRFQIGEGDFLKVKRVDDLSRIRPFEKAAASTAVIYLQKGHQTTYPVPCFVWGKKEARVKNKLGTYDDLDKVLTKVIIKEMIAFPADGRDATSIWITVPKQTERAIQSVLGENGYKARTGVFTGGANAVYWLEIAGETAGGKVVVSNIVDRAKRKVEKVTMEMEKDFVFPFVKGSNINQWEVESAHYLLCPHTSETKIVPLKEEEMRRQFPGTIAYLQTFKDDLNSRKGFAGWERQIQKRHFHALLRIGEYTFSPYKVAWRYIASEFITAVISCKDDEVLGRKLLIPNEKIMYISLYDEAEAYYVCGILSSDPVAFCVKSYMNPISISTHVLEKLNIPTFQPNDARHKRISQLCKLGHQVKDRAQKQAILTQVNEVVAEIYGLNQAQMEAISEELMVNGPTRVDG